MMFLQNRCSTSDELNDLLKCVCWRKVSIQQVVPNHPGLTALNVSTSSLHEMGLNIMYSYIPVPEDVLERQYVLMTASHHRSRAQEGNLCHNLSTHDSLRILLTTIQPRTSNYRRPRRMSHMYYHRDRRMQDNTEMDDSSIVPLTVPEVKCSTGTAVILWLIWWGPCYCVPFITWTRNTSDGSFKPKRRMWPCAKGPCSLTAIKRRLLWTCE